MNYREFVKENFHKLPASMPAKDKMKKIGEMWRKSGHSSGKGVSGGAVDMMLNDIGLGVSGGKMKAKKSKGGSFVGGMLESLLGGDKGMLKVPVGGKMKKVNKSKAMKSAGGAIPWNWQFIDPSRGISEQLQDYYIKGLVGQTNPLGKATLAQVQKAGGDEQTLAYNHQYWDAKDESNRLLNAVQVDNQRRADEPSGLEKFAQGALGAITEGATKALTEGAGVRGKKKAKGGMVVGGASVGGDVAGGSVSKKDKMKMLKKMYKLEMSSHNKKPTKKQDIDLKHLHRLHAGGFFDEMAPHLAMAML
jgi:hypothetical protein